MRKNEKRRRKKRKGEIKNGKKEEGKRGRHGNIIQLKVQKEKRRK
jgi:hypothetical protein